MKSSDRVSLVLLLALFVLLDLGAYGQVSNGPLIGFYRTSMEKSLNNDYPASQKPVGGIGAGLGYFVGGSLDRTVGFRGEFILKIRHFSYAFDVISSSGDYRLTLGSIQIPGMIVLRVHGGLRLMAGPMIDIRFIANNGVKGMRYPSEVPINWRDSFGSDLKTLGIGYVGGLEYRSSRSIAIALRIEQSVSRLLKEGRGNDANVVDLGLVISFDILGRPKAADPSE